ncbi:MAG TPA: hypothetical protein VFD70_19390 [Anaerolineae bacterium]|nr:hypothetical protein [Anaerolineae bacterium]
MNQLGENNSDPRYHTARIKAMLNDVTKHLREDVTRVNDPRAQALFETSAQVLQGLVKAYEHFETQAEPAWK